MSEFHVEVVKLGSFQRHPNADTLDVTKVFDYTVVAKRDNFYEGQLVVYVPIDSVVPDNDEWHWLAPRNPDGSERFSVGNVPQKYRVIDAKKLRGIFSQGCLAPLPPGDWKEGDNACDAMGITKYEPPLPSGLPSGGEDEAGPIGWRFPAYTDIEGLRRHPNALCDDEEVVITEKLHGASYRACHDGSRLWVGSRTSVKRRDEKNIWWRVAAFEKLEEKLVRAPMMIFYGETYGRVQSLHYDTELAFRVFDVFDISVMRYLDYDDAMALVTKCDLKCVPVLHRGLWNNRLNELSEGKSMLANHIREGFVVKPTKERWDSTIGRVILKRHGEGFLLCKNKR